MGLIQQGADLVYAIRFVRLLTMPWTSTDAYKLGIIDENGKALKRVSQFTTEKERSAYTPFVRLVFNIRRIMQTIPGGGSRLASYAAALWLLKEETGISDKALNEMVQKISGGFLVMEEHQSWNISNSKLRAGTYVLREDALLMESGEALAMAGTRVDVPEDMDPIGSVSGVRVFSVQHRLTGRTVAVTAEQLYR